MTFDAVAELTDIKDELRVLYEDIRLKMRSVSNDDPECIQKKYNIRQLHWEVIPLTDKYTETYEDYLKNMEIDTLLERVKLMRDGIKKLRSKLKLQAA